VSAIVVAACGVRVAKHGNRAVSSRAGSADLLEALGVRLDIDPDHVGRCIDEVGIGFLFAPAHHGALKHAAPVRRQLGLRTFFNLLGPLSNPARATHQLVGVYDAARVTQLAEVLGLLGVEAAWVVHGEGGLDEISPSGPTTVARLERGRVHVGVLHPSDFGLEPVGLESLRGGDAAENAAIARALFDGDVLPARAAVLLNAGAALALTGAVDSLEEGARRASEALVSGAAKGKLDAWVRWTRSAP
jgi:anthranilate phosphoribosyltransferase